MFLKVNNAELRPAGIRDDPGDRRAGGWGRLLERLRAAMAGTGVQLRLAEPAG